MAANDRLKAFVDRVERLEEEIAALNGDKKEVYAEAKGEGFDVAALKSVIAQRRKDPAKLAEFEAIVDLYKHALGMLPDEDDSRVHAREGSGAMQVALPAPPVSPISGVPECPPIPKILQRA